MRWLLRFPVIVAPGAARAPDPGVRGSRLEREMRVARVLGEGRVPSLTSPAARATRLEFVR